MHCTEEACCSLHLHGPPTVLGWLTYWCRCGQQGLKDKMSHSVTSEFAADARTWSSAEEIKKEGARRYSLSR